jgi:hypothetical protein
MVVRKYNVKARYSSRISTVSGGVAACLVWMILSPVHAAKDGDTPEYKLITADLATQGETFSGKVLAKTPQGDVPLHEGDLVEFNGRVTAPVQPGGVVEIPATAFEGEPVGNVFLNMQVVSAFGRPTIAPAPMGRPPNIDPPPIVSRHIEFLPRGSEGTERPTRIAKTSNSGDRPIMYGQGLDRLQRVTAKGQDGTTRDLGNSVGSSLQRIYFPPARLPKGAHRIEG